MPAAFATTVCPKCFTALRVPAQRIGEPTICPHCGTTFRAVATHSRAMSENPDGYDDQLSASASASLSNPWESVSTSVDDVRPPHEESSTAPILAPGASQAVTYGLISLLIFPLAPIFAPLALSTASSVRQAVRRGRGRYRGQSEASTASALAWVGFVLFVAGFVLGLLYFRTHFKPRERTEIIRVNGVK